MSEIKNVIVYIDFNEYEFKTIGYAAKIAEILGAEVTLMHVLHTGYDYFEVGGFGKSIEVAYKRSIAHARLVMDEYINEMQKFFKDLKIRKKLAMGHPLDEFINYVHLNSDLVVLPNHVKQRNIRFLYPDVTHKALRKLNNNIIFVNGEVLPRIDKIDIKKILVPIDFSDYSISALKFAAEIASKNNAEVHVINVIHPPRVPHELLEEIGLNYKEFVTVLERETGSRLEKLIEELGIKEVEAKVIEGTPPEVIVELSKDEFDMVAIGIKGRSKSEKLLVGNVTEQVVEFSHAPIAVIRSF